MKIEIEYNGAFAVCQVESMAEPGKIVNFKDADSTTQTYALRAFGVIKDQWLRDEQIKRYKNLPEIHIKREFQVHRNSLMEVEELFKEGIILEWSYDMSRDPCIKVLLNDNHTIINEHGWLVQDTEGRWWGMDNGYHRIMKQYNKIIKD